MSDDLILPGGTKIPEGDLEFRVSRSSGPGGQGVNTTDSQVELRFDLDGNETLSGTQKARVRRALGNRITNDGVLILAASDHRSQHRNKAEVLARFRRLITDAITPPKPRRPTRPSRGARERRLESKRQRAEIKRQRRNPPAP